MKSILLIFHLISSTILVNPCTLFEVNSKDLGRIQFSLIPNNLITAAGIHSGRPAYSATKNGSQLLYLYHVIAFPTRSGRGRWVINDELGSKVGAIAYIESWAILPHLIQHVNDNNNENSWYIYVKTSWTIDKAFQIYCTFSQESESSSSIHYDNTIYLESSIDAIKTSGFYIETLLDTKTKNITQYYGPIYSHIKSFDTDYQLYLYKYNSETWAISEIKDIGQISGVAYVIDNASIA
eukprot:gene15956-33585_t